MRCKMNQGVVSGPVTRRRTGLPSCNGTAAEGGRPPVKLAHSPRVNQARLAERLMLK